jgi:transglutaminase-like putative cysteine protease
VIYQIRHLTTYEYSKTVTFARCALRLAPRPDDDQAVLESDLTITPPPTRMETHTGQFGEQVVTAIIETPHRELKILAASRVEVTRPALLRPLMGEAWEMVREQAFKSTRMDLESPAQFLYPTSMTALQSAITAYAAEFFTPGRPVLEAAFALTTAIRAGFAYDTKSTEVSTPAIEAFHKRSGVCQDFAHIMIIGLRGLGLPASYVSGYLRTVPPPGKKRLEGADATHAWVDLWCGDALGWVGFDPTNGIVVAEDHIVLAVGRDYSDIAPIGGMVLGPGDQKIKVGVDVIPMEAAWSAA